MKTERRHELAENTLAHEIDVWGHKIRPYTNLAIGGLGVLLALYAAYGFWSNNRAARDQAAWYEYQKALLAGDVELKQLQLVASSDEFAGSKMQDWAYISWADRQVLLAANQYFVDREAAKKRLTTVAGVYEQLADASFEPEVRTRARLGLARVNEMQDRLDEAKQEYARVEGALGEYAARRAKLLEDKRVADDCRWLATAALPKPVAPTGPGTPGFRPGFEATQPPTDDVQGSLNSDAAKNLDEILGVLKTDEEGDRYQGEGEAKPQAGGEDSADSAGAGESDEATSGDAEAGESSDAAPASEAPAEK
jgi:hypothetical protein